MRKYFVYVAALIVGFCLSSVASGQDAQSVQQFAVPPSKAAVEKEHCGQSGQPGTLYEKLCLETNTSAPAPKPAANAPNPFE